MHQSIRQSDLAIVLPNPQDTRLTELVTGIDHTGAAVEVRVALNHGLGAEFGVHLPSSFRAHGRPEGLSLQEGDETVRNSSCVRFHQEPGSTRIDDGLHAAHPRAYRGHAGETSLDNAQRSAFVVARDD